VEVAVPAVAMVVPRAVPERGVTAVAVVAMVARAVHPVTGTAPAGLRTPVVLTQVHAIPEPARLGTGFREPALRASVSACVVPGLREVGQSQSRNGEGDDLPESAFMYVGTLDDARKKQLADEGMVFVEKALAIKGDFVEALIYKGLLLREQAKLTRNPATRNSLIEEAQLLQKRAVELKKEQDAELAEKAKQAAAAASTSN